MKASFGFSLNILLFSGILLLGDIFSTMEYNLHLCLTASDNLTFRYFSDLKCHLQKIKGKINIINT